MKCTSTLAKVIVLFLIVGCSNSEKTSTTIKAPEEHVWQVNLPNDKSDKLCKASAIADSVIYVPLETTSESLIGEIQLVEFNDSYIVVSDRKRIMAFQMNGKFIGQIGKTGNGPGEFTDIFNFILKEDTLFISSSGKYGLTKYLINGKYLGLFNQDFQMMYFTYLDRGGYAWYDKEKGDVVYFNNQWKATNTLHVENVNKQRESFISIATDDKHLIRNNNQLLFNNYRNDTIWDIASGRKKPVIIFNLKEKLLPDNLQLENIRNDETFRNKAKHYQRVNFMQTDSSIFVLQRSWTGTDIPQFYVFKKATNEVIQFVKPYIADDISGNMLLPIFFYTNKSIISLVGYDQIKHAQQKASSNKQKTYWEKYLLNAKENDNPVIAIIQTK